MMYVQATLFVPKLRHNLISIGQLNSNNYKIVLEEKHCKIFYKNTLVAEVPITGNRMSLLRIESNVVCLKALVNDFWLWHKSFGHLNFGSLSLMQNKNLVRGFHSSIESNNKICEGCAIGKQQRATFTHYQFSSYEPLALVHWYICGPMQNLSLGNNNYFSSICRQLFKNVLGLFHKS